MSHEIFYKRAFIKVGEDKYIPMIQHGSNNTFEMSWNNRQLSEKNWNNYSNNGFIFSKDEIAQIAKECEGYDNYKTRNTMFKAGEFEKWYKNGINTARTLEEYLSYGNRFYLTDWTDYKNQITYHITTTDELLAKIIEFKLRNIEQVSFRFEGRELRLPKQQREYKEQEKVDTFFVLENEKTGTLYKLSHNGGYRYVPRNSSGKKFKSQKEANTYLTKYARRLNGFEIKEVNAIAYI